MSKVGDFYGSLPGKTLAKNYIINGNFDIWQRGTSHTVYGYGSDDRWFMIADGSTFTNMRQTFTVGQTAVPGNPKYYSRTVVTTNSASSSRVAKVHRVEGVYSLQGGKVTLSFWAACTIPGNNIAVEMAQTFGTGGSPSSTVYMTPQKVALSSNWTKYTMTFDVPSITGKTLGSNNNDYLSVLIYFDAGSDSSTRTLSLGNQSGTFDIAQVQLEEGEIATEFERRTVGEELALCQRYYEMSVSPNYSGFQGYASSGVGYAVYTIFSVQKRYDPVVTLTTTGQSAFLASYTISSKSVSGFAEERVASGTGGGAFGSTWAADAEL